MMCLMMICFRYNENFTNKILYYEGEVIQSQREHGDIYFLIVGITEETYGYSYNDTVWVNYAGPRILEEDIVGFYGTVQGIEAHTAILGNSIEIPEIDSLHLSVIDRPLSNESMENEIEISNESVLREESQGTSKVSFSDKVESCKKELPKNFYYRNLTVRNLETLVSSDCLIEKAETTRDCKVYTNVVILEADETNRYTGETRHAKDYFDRVEECLTKTATKIALQNHDASPCDLLDDNTGCVSKYVREFLEPKTCQQAKNEKSCFAGYAWGITNEPVQREIYKKCMDMPLGAFVIKQNACKLEAISLHEFSSTELINWKFNGDMVVCSAFEFPPSIDNHQQYCLGSIGVYNKDLDVCDQSGTARAECYGFVAMTDDLVNLTTCDRLDSGVSFCYMGVAYRLNDISICDLEPLCENNQRDNCIRLVTKKNE